MALKPDSLTIKESFLQENPLLSEIEFNGESKPGKLHEFDLVNDEIWLLQCPKGMDLAKLQNLKLKVPGRTNIGDCEAVSMEFNEGIEQHAFAYCNRKSRYDLRLLPVRGTMVVRDRLKAATNVTAECAENYCPPAKRVPMPQNIRVRHPLLGTQYEDKLRLDKSIIQRLQKADEISVEILKKRLIQKHNPLFGTLLGKTIGKQGNIVSAIENAHYDAFDVSEEKHLKKKHKRKYGKSNAEAPDNDNASDKKKKSKVDDKVVSKDLQWIQNI